MNLISILDSINNFNEHNIVYEYVTVPDAIKKLSRDVHNSIPKDYHITLRFRPDNPQRKLYGKKVKYQIVAYGKSDKAEAVKVKLLEYPDNLKVTNKLLHITLTYKDKPVDSNYIENWKQIKDGPVLTGTIEGFKSNR